MFVYVVQENLTEDPFLNLKKKPTQVIYKNFEIALTYIILIQLTELKYQSWCIT